MKEIDRLLLAGTKIAGFVALGAGSAGATPLSSASTEIAARAAIQLAQADAQGAKGEERKAKRDDHDRKAGKRDAKEAGKRSADKADSKAPDRERAKKASEKQADRKQAGRERREDARKKEADQKQAGRERREDARKKEADQKQAGRDRREDARKKEADQKQDARERRQDAREDKAKADRHQDARDQRRNDRNNARDDRDRDHRNAYDDHDRDHRNARDDHDHDRRGAYDDRDERRTQVRNRTVIHVGGRVVVRHDDLDRLRRHARDVRVVTRPDGTRVTTVIRPDGSRIVTVEDARGRMIRRAREVNGREIVLFRNEHPDLVVVPPIALPPLQISIPRDRYIVEADRAPETTIVETLAAPPVERVERRYDLNEVLQHRRLREKLRRIDLTAITFATGSSDIPANQVDDLKQVAQALKQMIRKNPDEVFLIAGHTDAVGSEDDNLVLSDERAESVASVLTGSFNVPAANLVTQGYGEQFLKVQSEGAEQANRRVTIRRITPLLQQSASR